MYNLDGLKRNLNVNLNARQFVYVFVLTESWNWTKISNACVKGECNFFLEIAN